MENQEQRLEKLRKRWVEEPHNRKIIELQARLLKMGDGKESEYASGDEEFEAMILNEIVS